ncbi:MAG: cysteate synthase [Nitrospinota bacterium]|nr:cysteate synthase [Nitrospinota bacterium]
MDKYKLICCANGQEVRLKSPFDFQTGCHENSLLKAVYHQERLEIRNDLPGLWKYINWLPVNSHNEYSFGPVTYKSQGLAAELGLYNLWISFNGYYPDFGAYYKTCTFKELHAVVVIQYAKEHNVEKLVLASAGNTAVAFSYIAEFLKYPVVCVVPEKCMKAVQAPNMLFSNSKIVMLTGGDYSDALNVSRRLAALKGWTYEGGAKNFARRAGLGISYMDAVATIGRIPDHYFQGVGSGTGAIAAWHTNMLFIADGSYGTYMTKLHLAQNKPMTPMASAWAAGRNFIKQEVDVPQVENILDLVAAPVLTNKYPAYGISGGVYDGLRSTGGLMYGISNDELYEAGDVFKRTEGRDVNPPAAVATAALIKAVKEKKVGRGDIIMLNITGAGKEQRHRDLSILPIKPNLTITKEITDEELMELPV